MRIFNHSSQTCALCKISSLFKCQWYIKCVYNHFDLFVHTSFFVLHFSMWIHLVVYIGRKIMLSNKCEQHNKDYIIGAMELKFVVTLACQSTQFMGENKKRRRNACVAKNFMSPVFPNHQNWLALSRHRMTMLIFMPSFLTNILIIPRTRQAYMLPLHLWCCVERFRTVL